MRSINDYLLNKHTPNGRKYPYLDCWGLVVDVYREMLGISLNEYTDLSQRDMSKALMYERQSGRFIEVDDEPHDYDVIAFFLGGRLYHVGLWIGGKILHTSQKKNCRYETLDSRVSLSQMRIYRYVKSRDSQ